MNIYQHIKYHKQAVKSIERLDMLTKQRIKQSIEKLPHGDVKRLKGFRNLYRLRVGDWRILFTTEENNIIINDVLPRGNAYKGEL